MNSQEIRIKLIDYIEGNLVPEEKNTIKKLLQKDPNLQKEYETLKRILEDISDSTEEIPSPELKVNFLEAIEEEKKRMKEKKTWAGGHQKTLLVLGIAASLTLIIMNINFKNGIFNSLNTEKEISHLQEAKKDSLIMEMTSHPLASERLNAVNSAANLPMDKVLLDSFLKVISGESNQNVKIAALKALEDEKENSSVRKVLYNLTLNHKDPIVQIYAIDYLARLEDEKSNQILSQLLSDEATMEVVKEEAHLALFEINKNIYKRK